MDEVTTSTHSKKTPLLILGFIAVAVIAGFLGYWYGVKSAKPVTVAPDISAELPTAKVAADSIITSQEAVAVGNISKADSNSITVVGNDGQIANFKLSPKYSIYQLPASSSAAPKSSTNINDIKLNQKYLIHLVLQGTQFAATTIQALPAETK